MVGIGTIKTVAILAGVGIVAIAAWRLGPRAINWVQEAGAGLGSTLNEIGSNIGTGLTGFTQNIGSGLASWQLPEFQWPEWPTDNTVPTAQGTGLTGGTTTMSPDFSEQAAPYVEGQEQPECPAGHERVYDEVNGYQCLTGEALRDWVCKHTPEYAGCDQAAMSGEDGTSDLDQNGGANTNSDATWLTQFAGRRVTTSQLNAAFDNVAARQQAEVNAMASGRITPGTYGYMRRASGGGGGSFL